MARKHGKDRGLFQWPPDSGVWWIEWHDAERKRRRKKIGAKDAAQKAYLVAKANAIRGVKIAAHQPPRGKRVEDVITAYIAESAATKRSASDDARYGEVWRLFLGSKQLDEVTPADVEAWRQMRLRQRPRPAPATLNRHIAFLKRVFNVAIRDGLTERNPAARVKLQQEENTRIRYLSDDEEARLKAQCSEFMWVLVLLAIHTGLRQAEQFGLRWEHVDLTHNVLRIPRSKSGEARAVELNAEAWEILRHLPSRQRSEWVFPAPPAEGKHGRKSQEDIGHLTFPSVRSAFEGALKRAAVPNFRWHDLRHTFASRLTAAGVPAQTVMELMGHRSLAMVLRYSHLSPGHRHDAVAKLVSHEAPPRTAIGGQSPPQRKQPRGSTKDTRQS